MRAFIDTSASATGLRVGVAVSGYHSRIMAMLREGALEAFRSAGGRDEGLEIVPAPGSFELTAICRALAHRGNIDAIVALGCIIAGQTRHDRYLAMAVAHGLTSITVETGVPIAFGVLTCQNMKQARARAGGERGNKGAEAMAAAIQAANAIRRLRNPSREHSSGASSNGSIRKPVRTSRSRGKS